MGTDKKASWIKRVEDLVTVLKGSTISELELTEGGTEIIIRRKPGIVMTAAPGGGLVNVPVGESGRVALRQERGIAIVAPLTGVYYSSPSPTSPSFVSVGDVVQAGQVVALVEAMKVFNEITSEISGRVSEMIATNGNIVQKGDVLLRIEQV